MGTTKCAHSWPKLTPFLILKGDDLLAEFYESRALLRSEEAILIMGLLVSLNVVDCNLCVKARDRFLHFS